MKICVLTLILFSSINSLAFDIAGDLAQRFQKAEDDITLEDFAGTNPPLRCAYFNQKESAFVDVEIKAVSDDSKTPIGLSVDREGNSRLKRDIITQAKPNQMFVDFCIRSMVPCWPSVGKYTFRKTEPYIHFQYETSPNIYYGYCWREKVREELR
jgi:hypothetical protein